MTIGFWLLSAAGFLLELLVVVAVLRSRQYRRYSLILILSLFGLVAEIILTLVLRYRGATSPSYGVIYWSEDLLNHGLILILLLTLIAQAAGSSRSADRFMLLLALAVVAFGLGSFAILHNDTAWQTALSRNLSFCEEVLNFVLWTALIRSRLRDTLLFLVSAGIGLQVTGEVIGHTIRIYTGASRFVWLPDILVVASEMLCLLIWIYAFWHAPRPAPSAPDAS